MAGKINRGLGRGLDALFADQTPVDREEHIESAIKHSLRDSNNGVTYIKLNDIKPNKNQPRKIFNEEKIMELADSISLHGVIQPVVVRKQQNGFEIVAGERRWRAARAAGLKEIPCIVREFSDEENMLIAIIENMQREDLNPIEEAQGLNQMIKNYGMTQEEVSKSVSKSRPYITNSIRLLKLPESVQRLISDGKISSGHGRCLISVENKRLQQELIDKVVQNGLSVRELEKLVSKGKKATGNKADRGDKSKSYEILSVENSLKEIFGTKVNIVTKGKKGYIEMEFYGKDDLNRLIDLLSEIKK